MTLTIRRHWLTLSLVLGLALTVVSAVQAKDAKPAAAKPPPGPEKLVLEPRAMDLLKASADRLAAAKSMSFTAVASYEYPSQLGPAILYSVRYDVTMQRPSGLRVLIPGDGPASEFYYDGKTITAFAPKEGLAAVADAPPTLDAALKLAYETADIYYPFTDLLVSDPWTALTEGVILAFYIGPSDVIGGTRTEMVAWANDEVFLQIWIGSEDRLPRRVRAVYKTDPLRLRHQVDISDWKIDQTVPDGTFVSTAAAAAKRIKFDRPAHLSAPPPLNPLKTIKPAAPAAKSP